MRETDKEAADWLNLGIVQVKYLCKICAKKACSYSNFLLNSFVRNKSNPSSIHIDKYIDSFRKKIPKNLVRYFTDLDDKRLKYDPLFKESTICFVIGNLKGAPLSL